jgi:hypothetical protein
MFIRPMVAEAAPSGPPLTVLTGLVSWWSLNETTGTRADSHGSNDLDVISGTTYRSAVVGNGIDLNGTTSWVGKDVPTGLGAGATSFSFCCWANFDALNASNTVASVATGGVPTNWGWLMFSAYTAIRFYVGVGAASPYVEATTFGALSTGTNYLLYGEYNSATGNLGISVNAGTLDTASAGGTPNSITEPFFLGILEVLGYHMDGVVDEAAFWSRVLTSEEITGIYNSGSGAGYPG